MRRRCGDARPQSAALPRSRSRVPRGGGLCCFTIRSTRVPSQRQNWGTVAILMGGGGAQPGSHVGWAASTTRGCWGLRCFRLAVDGVMLSTSHAPPSAAARLSPGQAVRFPEGNQPRAQHTMAWFWGGEGAPGSRGHAERTCTSGCSPAADAALPLQADRAPPADPPGDTGKKPDWKPLPDPPQGPPPTSSAFAGAGVPPGCFPGLLAGLLFR